MAVDPAVATPRSAFELNLGTERDCPLRYAEPGVYPTFARPMASRSASPVGPSSSPRTWLRCAASRCPRTPNPPPRARSLRHPRPSPCSPRSASEPLKVPPGATFSFKIILSDLSDKAVSLSPCPWFTETTDSAPPTTVSYFLNCAAVPGVLEPGDSLVLWLVASAPTVPGWSSVSWTWGAPYQENGETMPAAPEPGVDVPFDVR